MLTLLSGIGLRVWGYIAAVVAIVVGLLSLFSKAKQAGRDEVANKVNSDTAGANERMLNASTQAPKDVKNVQNDLRSGKF